MYALVYFACVHVCMCACVHVCMCAPVCGCMSVEECLCTCVCCVGVCVHLCLHVCADAQVHYTVRAINLGRSCLHCQSTYMRVCTCAQQACVPLHACMCLCALHTMHLGCRSCSKLVSRQSTCCHRQYLHQTPHSALAECAFHHHRGQNRPQTRQSANYTKHRRRCCKAPQKVVACWHSSCRQQEMIRLTSI